MESKTIIRDHAKISDKFFPEKEQENVKLNFSSSLRCREIIQTERRHPWLGNQQKLKTKQTGVNIITMMNLNCN